MMHSQNLSLYFGRKFYALYLNTYNKCFRDNATNMLTLFKVTGNKNTQITHTVDSLEIFYFEYNIDYWPYQHQGGE